MAEPVRVFVSYRRDDTPHVAGRLGDRLRDRFDRVFMDIDNVDPGLDFTEVIRNAVAECDVLLALIGTRWESAVDEDGRRRLEDPDDWIVEEVRVALQRGIPVIPVLVDGARMPRRSELPPAIGPLANRQAATVQHASFTSDAGRLIASIDRVLGAVRPPPQPVENAGDVAAPAPSTGVGAGTTTALDDPEYTAALAAFFAERWDEAVGLLTAVSSRHPGHPRIGDRLARARQQKQLADLDGRAERAAELGDWADSVTALEQLAAVDPGYRDAANRLAVARERRHGVDLQGELRALHVGGHWTAVIAAGEELAALDPASADPDGLVSDARARLAEQEIAARYATGLRQLDDEAWTDAVATFAALNDDQPGYRDTSALLARARRLAGHAPSSATPLFVPEPRTLQVGQWVLGVAFSPDGMWLATGSRRRLRLWDLRTGDIRWSKDLGGWSHDVKGVAFSPDGARLAAACDDKTARVFEASTGDQHLEVRHAGYVHAVAFSPDGTCLATGSADSTAAVWDAVTGLSRLQVRHAADVRAVAFSPDASRLATGSYDTTAKIWDATTGEVQLEVGHGSFVDAVAFTTDGMRLASASRDNTGRIWDAVTGQQQLSVSHDRWVVAVAFSPDGTRLATGSWDNTCRIWDASTGDQHRLLQHADTVRALVFSPDGTRLATGSVDKTARIWDATPA